MTELEEAKRLYIENHVLRNENASFGEAFEAGVQWKAKQSPWISVEERLPEKDDDLYIALNTKMTPPGIDVCEFDVKSKRWTDSRHIVVYPTHWMNIPPIII